MADTMSDPLSDLRSRSTRDLAAAYIASLRSPRPGASPAVARLQSEWSRRPAAERRAALREYRESLGKADRAVYLLAAWADELRAR